jgi:glutaredoxin
MWQLTLLSKPDCPLCDEAKLAIEEFSRECPLNLTVVDVSTDQKLWERYKFEIPVLLIDNQEAASHHVGLKKLRVLRSRWEKGEPLAKSHTGLFPAV